MKLKWMAILLIGACLSGCGDGGSDAKSSGEVTATIYPVSSKTSFSDGGEIKLFAKDASGRALQNLTAISVDKGQTSTYAFSSEQVDLVANDNNAVADVYSGAYDGTIQRVSALDGYTWVNANGPSGQASLFPGLNSISRHTVSVWGSGGEDIAFVSDATNLVGSDTNGVSDIYRRTTRGRTYRVSVAADGTEPATASFSPSGMYSSVAFVTSSALVSADTNGTYDVYLKNIDSGNLTLISRSTAGQISTGASFDPQMVGSCVFFLSWADNLVEGDTNQSLDLFRYCPSSYQQDAGLVRVPLAKAGQGDKGILGPSYAGQIVYASRLFSVDESGQYVAFLSESSNLVTDDNNGKLDAFVHSMQEGITVRVSVNVDNSKSGATMNGIHMGSASGYAPVVAFASDQALTGQQTAGGIDIYTRVFALDRMLRISNTKTDSWPMVDVDYIQGGGGYTIIYSGSAQALSGAVVKGVFQVDVPLY